MDYASPILCKPDLRLEGPGLVVGDHDNWVVDAARHRLSVHTRKRRFPPPGRRICAAPTVARVTASRSGASTADSSEHKLCTGAQEASDITGLGFKSFLDPWAELVERSNGDDEVGAAPPQAPCRHRPAVNQDHRA